MYNEKIGKLIKKNVEIYRYSDWHLGEFSSESNVIQLRLSKHKGLEHGSMDTQILDHFEVVKNGKRSFHVLVHCNARSLHVKVDGSTNAVEVSLIDQGFNPYGRLHQDIIDKIIKTMVNSLAGGMPLRTAVGAMNRLLVDNREGALELLDLIEVAVQRHLDQAMVA